MELNVKVPTKAELIKVTSLKEAAEAFIFVREKEGLGARDLKRKDGWIYDEAGKKIAHISYNGKVWMKKAS